MFLTLDDSTYLFEPCEIMVTQWNILDKFKDKDAKLSKKKTLIETVTEVKQGYSDNKYAKLEDDVRQLYGKYLDYPIGEFLFELKSNNDPFYQLFLNCDIDDSMVHGDGPFCKFHILDERLMKEKGLYVFCVDDICAYIGEVTKSRTFKTIVNSEYGSISAKMCYIDGQPVRCRINHLINRIGDENRIAFKVHPMKDDFLIGEIEKQLINKYNPRWNKKGRTTPYSPIQALSLEKWVN